MPALQRIEDSGTTQRQCHAGDPNAAAHLLMDPIPDPFVQNMFVLCHGEAVISGDDVNVDAQAGARPWDPPLTARGKQQAWRVGRKIKLEGWNVTRVVVSPFLRCVQTAVEVVAGLSTVPGSGVPMWDRDDDQGSDSVSTIKASIECGLAENLMNKQGVILPRPSEVEDKQEWLQPWTLELAELYSMLPIEIQDPSFQPIKQKLPQNRESTEDSRCRYTSTLKKIANRYLHENILYITHGEGVRQSVSMMWPRAQVKGVTYGAYTHAQRPIFEGENGDWELLTESGSSSGILLRQYTCS